MGGLRDKGFLFPDLTFLSASLFVCLRLGWCFLSFGLMLVLGRNGDSDLVSFTPSPSPCVYVSVSSRVKKSKVSLWNMRQVVSSQSKTTSVFLSPPMEAEMEDDRPFVLLA